MELAVAARRLKISITDNGRELNPGSAARGNGLNNMRERLARLNGQCHLHSEPGKGTTVLLMLPQ